jgi:glycosyltransferase involved in cell wall biosynthesis
MRILQIIDSLEAGGAERMAVNYANALSDKIEFSGLVATRNEGVLLNQINSNVSYFCLNKTTTFDFKAIRLFRKIIRNDNIDLIHAHGTSFFTAFMLKIFCPRLKIVYHEHYGQRANQTFLSNIPLLFCSLFFNQILVVNLQIKEWFSKFGFHKAIFFPNFATFSSNNISKTILNGQEGKRIVCLANLKNPKNHQLLIRAFHKLNLQNKDWTLHFIGRNYKDDYFFELKKVIKDLNIVNSVYFYDSQNDIENILSQATIGVLCSTQEGFPVTLLEYGLANLPVLSSKVGFCSTIVTHNETGLLFDSNNLDSISDNLNILVENINLRAKYSNNLNSLVKLKYSQEIVISNLIKVYSKVLNEK